MKINKILAAGIAATLAVTSVGAVVASAETKTFDMAKTLGNMTVNYSYKSFYGDKVAGSALQAEQQKIKFTIRTYVSIFKDLNDNYCVVTYPETATDAQLVKIDNDLREARGCDYDNNNVGIGKKFDTTKYEWVNTYMIGDAYWPQVYVTVNGYKRAADGKTLTSVSQKVAVEQNWEATDFNGPFYQFTVLKDDEISYKEDAVATAYFDYIDSIEVTAQGKIRATAGDHGIQYGLDDTPYMNNEEEWNIISSQITGRKIFVGDAVVTGGTQGAATYTASQAANEALVNTQLALAENEIASLFDDEVEVLVPVAGAGAAKGTEPAGVYEKDVQVDNYVPGAALVHANWSADMECDEVTGDFLIGGAAPGAAKVYKVVDGAETLYVSTEQTAGQAITAGDTYAAPVKVQTYKASETDYTGYTVAADYIKADHVAVAAGAVTKAGAAIGDLYNVVIAKAADAAAVEKKANSAAAVLAYCVAHGGYSPAKGYYTDTTASSVSTESSEFYSLLERTTTNATIKRADVKVLSWANAYTAQNGGHLGQTDSNQSYKDENHEGDNPFQFAGLASQVADFFNKKTNGKIIFHFTSVAKGAGSWKNGGVPSTEVGLKSSLAGTNMGLFVNYNQSTGSLQTAGVVDADASTVTFDISEILDDMGGLTKGNISDLFYGLNTGIKYVDYNNKIGYLVDTVTLSYDENAAATDGDKATQNDDDDDDDDDDTDVTDDDDDDDDDADDADDDDDDDDDDASLDDDDDDDDDVANAEDINTPADDDANPGTGVALAVIPAIVAAAAAVVSKKRK